MNTLTLLSALTFAVLTYTGSDTTKIGFAGAKADELPKGWRVAKTGQGTGGDWQIVADKDAPGGLALAQTKADKKATFNLCIM
jgi:hypothetical protein